MRDLSFSLLYAPPEIIEAVVARRDYVPVDTAADVWALGVIAFELLTHSRAFPASSTRDSVVAQLLGQAPLPWEAGGAAFGAVARLRGLRRSVMRCLARDAHDRPSTAEVVETWDHMFDTVHDRKRT